MRPGPTTEALSGPTAIGARVSIHLGDRVIAADVPAQKVQIDWTGDRVVPGQLTYEAPADWVPQSAHDPLNNYGQRSHIVAIVDTMNGRQEIDLGFWQHEEWSQESGHVKVQALDLMQVLEADPMAWPSSPPRGATVRSELQRLAGPLPVILDPGTPNELVPVTTQWGHSRTEAIRDLCTARGLEWAVKPDGCLHVWERRDGRKPDAAYSGRDLLVDAPLKSLKRGPNRWVVVGSPQDTEGGDSRNPRIKWTGVATLTEPPYDPRTYGWVTDRREFNAASNEAAVHKAADSYRKTALSAARSRSLEIVPDPRLEAGDIIAVHTMEGETIVGRVTAYSLPVDDPNAKMRVDVEELAW